MNILRSPSARSESQPDLSKLGKKDLIADQQITNRKRKHPPSECNTQQEIAEFRSEMMSFLKDFSNTQSSIINNLRDEIVAQLKVITDEQFQLKSDLITYKKTTDKDIDSLKDSLNFHSKLQDETTNKLQIIASEINKMEDFQQGISLLQEKVDNLHLDLNFYQQRERISNLEITGLPETRNENLMKYLISIGKIAKVQLAEKDILTINRVEPRNKSTGRSRVIVAKLATKILRDSIISGIRKNRGLSTLDIGLPGEPQNVYINEHLTGFNKLLFRKTRGAAKVNGYKYSWVKYGNIFVRKNDTNPALNIRSMKDVDKIK